MSKVLDHVKSPERISDLERILLLAEELQEKCAHYSQRIEIYRWVQMVLLGLGISGGILLGLRTYPDLITNFALFPIAIFLINAAALEYIVRNLKRRTRPDRIALADLVELLRETESALGEAQNWSTLDRAQFRIRLSRFGIGSEGWHT